VSRWRPVLAVLAALATPAGTAADEAPVDRDEDILEAAPPFQIEEVRVSTMALEQTGHGYQSDATRDPQAPGAEDLVIVEPILHVAAQQGERLHHELWVPLDVVSSASADAIDVTSSASRVSEAGSIELDTSWRAAADTTVSLHPKFHAEEQTRGWGLGLGVTQALADDNAVLAASFHEKLDWVDRFYLDGDRRGRELRATMNANVALTQVLTATTIAGLNYGLTLQRGELGNGWNTVPSTMGGRDLERALPTRWRHALVARVAQWLPWSGALRASYRFYLDDWSIRAHSAEVVLEQRLVPALTVAASARVHTQTAARFWGDRFAPDSQRRTGDSDLAALDALTVGLRAALELGDWRVDAGYERYSRSNGLRANIATCSLGARF